MTKYVNVWTIVIIFGYILQPIYTVTTYTSKACYGSRLPCNQHTVSCDSTQKIAIYDAYYTDNTECGAGISHCGTVNPDNVTEYGYHRFNNSELVSLYGNCSTLRRCVCPGRRRRAVLAFSVVKYQCIEDAASLTVTGGHAEGVSQVSITNTDEVMANSTIQNNTYMCSFKADDQTTRISVYSLDVRMRELTTGQCLSRLTVLPENYIATTNCSSAFKPFERLNVTAKLPTSIYLDIPSVSSTLIWLMINASGPFDVKCEPVTNTGGFTTESAIKRSSTITTSQISGAVTKDDFPNPRLHDSQVAFTVQEQEPIQSASVFMGGVATGAVIVILVGLSVYFLVIRRRYDLTAKKQGDTPASDEHPTYSGLSSGTDTNNYATIEQPARSEEDTTRGTTATPDYQNI